MQTETNTMQTETDTMHTDPTYEAFIAAKVAAAPEMGFSAPLPLHDSLFPHQREPRTPFTIGGEP